MTAKTKSNSPQLAFEFCLNTTGCTELINRYVSYPWSFTQPFYLGDGPTGMATVIPQSVSGGLFRGDDLFQSVVVGTQASVQLASQGATLVNNKRQGTGAFSKWNLVVKDGGWLEVLNDPVILGTGAALHQNWSIEVAPSSTLLLIDAWTYRSESGSPAFLSLSNELSISRPGGQLLGVERTFATCDALLEQQDAFGFRAEAFVNGLILTSLEEDTLSIHFLEQLTRADGCWVGLSRIPNGGGVAIRAACASASVIAPFSELMWQTFRRLLLGVEPDRRRRGL